jgi:hypothetical protein
MQTKNQWRQDMYMAKTTTSTLLLTLGALTMSTGALATGTISALGVSKGINNAGNCTTCHNATSGNESKANLKAGYQTAYNQDTVNLTALKALINGTPTPPAPPTVPPTTPSTSCDDKANAAVCANQAHQYGTVGSATSGKAKTDVYKVKCAKKTASLSASVMDMAPDNVSKISVQVSKGSSSSPLGTDKTDGDSTYSRKVKLAKGSGVYLVKVNKSKSATPGAELYDVEIMCKDAKRKQTVSTASIKQNQ